MRSSLFFISASALTALGAPVVSKADNNDNRAVSVLSSSSRRDCDGGLKVAFRPDPDTHVILVKAFRTGDDLSLNAKPSGTLAKRDLCLVKLNVGPGNPGPPGAPSTSPGIGIEIWLPAPADWTGRTRIIGGGGFAGTPADPLKSVNSRAGDTAASGG